ncbi:MAG: hypothetical protein ABWY12_06940 [Burkholderiales bacterium]
MRARRFACPDCPDCPDSARADASGSPELFNVGFNVGLTQEQIVGTLIQCIPYVGFPRVLTGLTLLKEVIAERGMTPDTDDSNAN